MPLWFPVGAFWRTLTGYGALSMDPIRWKSRPQLRDPVLVCAFNGWNDAGEAASAALGLILGDFGGNEVADIDPEEFFDFTAVRPTIRLVEGRTRVVDWPSNTFHAAHVPAAERDLLLMTGTEPSLKWRAFNEAIIRVAEEVGVELVVTLGALLADVPHTRPVGVTGFASDESLDRPPGLLSGRATRGRPGSSARSTTRASSTACRRRACGRRCRTTWPPLQTRRPRSR